MGGRAPVPADAAALPRASTSVRAQVDATVAPITAPAVAELIVRVDRGEVSCALRNVSANGFHVANEQPGYRVTFVVHDVDDKLVPESPLGRAVQAKRHDCLGCLFPQYVAAGAARELQRIKASDYFVLARRHPYSVSCAYDGELVLSGKESFPGIPAVGEKVPAVLESERVPFKSK